MRQCRGRERVPSGAPGGRAEDAVPGERGLARTPFFHRPGLPERHRCGGGSCKGAGTDFRCGRKGAAGGYGEAGPGMGFLCRYLPQDPGL